MKEKIITIESQLKMPAMQLPIKSTIVSIENRTVLISPVPHLKKFKDQVEGLGPITDIVAPNGFHHLGINDAIEMYPDAKLWGVPALKTKRSDINWSHILPENWPFQGTLDAIPLLGMPKIDEMIFYLSSEKTLIVSDLFFNHIHGKGFGYWMVFNMFGTYKRFAVSKFFMKFIKNNQEFKQSLQKILALNIEKIIVSHGEDVLENAKEKLLMAFKERGLI